MKTANRLLFKRFFIAKLLTYILYKLQFVVGLLYIRFSKNGSNFLYFLFIKSLRKESKVVQTKKQL